MGYRSEFLANPMPTVIERQYNGLKYLNLNHEQINPVRAYRVAKWVGMLPLCCHRQKLLS